MEWSTDSANRTNPCNGLCLNPFFHKAYDKLLIAITPDLKIRISDEIISNTKERLSKDYLQGLNGNKIYTPNKFQPQKEFLEAHYDLYKQRQGNG